jgi:hypothetical protein
LASSSWCRTSLSAVTIAVIAGAFSDICPAEIPDANAAIRIVQQVGGSFGAAVLAVILASELVSHHAVTAAARGIAFDAAFWSAIGLTMLTLLPALLLPAAVRPRAKRVPGQRHDQAVSSLDGSVASRSPHWTAE